MPLARFWHAEPLLQERNAIVRGDKVPEGSESEAKGIPGFWATVFKNHEAFEDMLNNKDEEVLKLLSDVRVERFQTEKGGKLRWAVKIIFAFAENEYFEEKELTKTFFYEDQRENIGAETEGCNITWKPGALRPQFAKQLWTRTFLLLNLSSSALLLHQDLPHYQSISDARYIFVHIVPAHRCWYMRTHACVSSQAKIPQRNI